MKSKHMFQLDIQAADIHYVRICSICIKNLIGIGYKGISAYSFSNAIYFPWITQHMVVIWGGIALRVFPPKVFECWAGLAARQHKLRKKRKMPSPGFELGTSDVPVRHADQYTMKSN